MSKSFIMLRIIGNKIKLTKQHFQRNLLIVIILISLALVTFNTSSYTNQVHNKPNEIIPDLNSFNKDNYSKILTSEKHGLGNITIDDIEFNIPLSGFLNENVYYPLVTEDLLSESLSINLTEQEFIETTSPALVDNLNTESTEQKYATFTFNETIEVKYNNTKARYLIYHPRFSNSELLGFYVNNGTLTTELIEDIDYTFGDLNYIVFFYEDYFQMGRIFNFTMYFTWKCLIAFQNWKIEQLKDQALEITEIEQDLSVDFNYNFYMVATGYGLNLDDVREIDFWDVALTINPLDKELFTNHILMLNGIEVNIASHLNPDKSIHIELSDLFTPSSSTFVLNFTTKYTLRFDNPVGSSWAIDRLVEQRSIRERIYFCNLISGPRHIYLKNVGFNESGIYFEEVINSYSLFNRKVEFSELNINITGYLGLNVVIPYLYVGEICPVLIKYFTFQKLKIIITDDIKMPLVGAKIEIFHFGAPYGTYISNITSQPIIPRRSDENGKIVVNNVPRGNYTIRIYWQGNFVKEASISTFTETNYIYTNIPHSPLWIIIFGTIIGIVLIIGAIFYLKYKTPR
ncbi:MAG: hypothetical protein ACFE8B_17030 [Candidatus Hermodarchaeota archaeon]